MKLNKIASAVKVQLDKERTMILDFNAFALFSDVTGQELPDVFAGLFERDAKGELVYTDKKKGGFPKVAKDLTPKQLRAAVWAGCHHEDYSLQINQVGRHISQSNRAELTLAVFQSLLGLEVEPKDPTQAVEAEPTSHGIGIVSGASAASISA